MTSDKGRSVFLYDPAERKYSTFFLEYEEDKCLDSPEGVALSEDGKQLFIVNDEDDQEDSRLLSYGAK